MKIISGDSKDSGHHQKFFEIIPNVAFFLLRAISSQVKISFEKVSFARVVFDKLSVSVAKAGQKRKTGFWIF